MSPRRVTRHSNRGSNRRKLVWSTVDTGLTVPLATGFQNLDLLTDLKVGGASVLGSTIMRVHLVFSPSSAVTANDGIYVGLGVFQQDDVGTFTAATGANVVNANAQREVDWMMWEHRVATPTYGYESANNHIVWDVKSRRRLEELQQTLVFSYAPQGVATVPATGLLTGRVLVALP